jgi:glycosyltransferase involved in cell wall biosynthesis
VRHGIDVDHPRFAVIPRVGMSLAPLLLYAGAVGALTRLRRDGFDFDLIDAHYFYPDGVAAVMLGQHFQRPVVITARGTDVNVIPRFALPRRMILRAAAHAAAIVTVSRALKDSLIGLGVRDSRISVLRNGVDLDMFRPPDRVALRQQLGLAGPTMLCVGHLLDAKGHGLAIAALPKLPGVTLVIVGDGPERPAFEALSQRLGVADRVRFLGKRPHGELAALYGVADVLVLASAREGWPNVLLESMACGTPVVASRVGGIAEVLTAPEAGCILPERTPDAIAEAVQFILAAPPDRAATRAYAEKFGWDETTRGQIALFEEVLRSTRR